MRVNLRKVTVEAAMEYFKNKNFELTENIEDLGKKEANQKYFLKDFHLKDVLLFAARTDFHEDEWVIEGKLLLQDKASCLSASVLLEDCTPCSIDDREKLNHSSSRFCDIIDACAAPGNKTTHLGALMGSDHSHQLFAVEKDERRVELLRQFTTKAGIPVNILHQSFLDIKQEDEAYKNVKYFFNIFLKILIVFYLKITHVLVDPSCSGSGIVSRLDSLLESYTGGFTDDRKHRLAKFQKQILSHALQCLFFSSNF